MKRVCCAVLALCLLFGALPAVRGEETDLSAAEPVTEPTETPPPEPTPVPTLPPASAAPSPEPTELPPPDGFRIDNANLYDGMDRRYSEGYVPGVEDGAAVIVLPLLTDTTLQNDELRARVDLGDPVSGPFQTKNYEKTVRRADNRVNGGPKTVSGWCVVFRLQLRSDRYNGSYPVTVHVTARDRAGTALEQDFTVYVTVTDGKDPNPTEPPQPPEPTEPPVILGPKVLVQSARVISGAEDDGSVQAGGRAKVCITLKNTSRTEALQNMAVTAGSPGETFALVSASDSVFLGDLAADGTAEITYEYDVKPETPAGQYGIPLTYDFAYGKGMTGSGSGTARITVTQPLEVEFALLQMPAEAVVSDTVEVTVQAVNLSHADAYNVRATIEADGLLPGGVVFIGDLPGGASEQAAVPVRITSLTGGNFAYGMTDGTVTYQYSDSDGNEFSETGTFSVNIQSPFSGGSREEPDDPNQWWFVMAGVLAAVLILAAILLLRAAKRRREP